MDHDWIVEVEDEKGTAVTTGATVALVPASTLVGKEWPFASVAATHTHKSGGVYEASAPIVFAAGDWMLIVRLAKKSPVVQPVKMRAKSKTEMQTLPSPKTAATLAFSSELKTIGKAKLRRSRFKVTMYPSSEVVFISGTEYFGAGTHFRVFAENHGIALRREKKIDDGVIVTLFSADDRTRDTLVLAVGGGLLKVAGKSFGPTSGITPGKKHDPVAGLDVSVTDPYKYLSAVGASEPGRVLEVGFFSHSFPGGPILFNIGDSPSNPARLSTDYDARRKDFNSTNTVGWPKMKAAMAADGNWHVWGCSATTHHKNAAAKAQEHKKEGDDFYFTVETTAQHHDGSPAQCVEERTTRKRVRAQMDERFRSTTYMAAAAKYLGVAVYGAPPGVGSSFADPAKKIPGHPEMNVMFIDRATYSNVYVFFKDEFGPEFAPTNTPFDKGYVDYKRIATRAIPAAAAFSSQYYYFSRDYAKAPKIGRTRLQFANSQRIEIDGTKTKLKITAKSGFAAPGKQGHLYEVHETADATKSQAAYVQEDGKVFEVTKDSAGKFTVLGALLP